VWLSEIMLQQTTAKAVAPYYSRFLARWPSLQDLASVRLVEVLKLWAGLGYYARARNLHACARAIVARHDGAFPQSEAELRALPGIGGYTAAAIAAIAFDRKATPVDGNIERVVARLFAVEEALPAAKPAIMVLAQTLTPARRAGDFAQAMMDLGATICTPKRPACALCPWNEACAARLRGDQETFPRKTPKAQGRLRRGAAFVAVRADGAVLVRTRPPQGLLGGMTEVPTSEWTHDFDSKTALAAAPHLQSPPPPGPRLRAPGRRLLRGRSLAEGEREGGKRRTQSTQPTPLPNPPPQGGMEQRSDGEREKRNGASQIVWRKLPGRVTHTFTHFPLELIVYTASITRGAKAPVGARWLPVRKLAGEALPNVMRKVIAHALE
jgi:A/G-specific adenine glycosylase